MSSSTPIPFDIHCVKNEKQKLQAEIKRMQACIRDLKKKEDEIDRRIEEYFKEMNSQGVILGDVTIINEAIKRVKPVPKKIKEENINKLLRPLVTDSVMNELAKLSKGTDTIKHKIVIKETK